MTNQPMSLAQMQAEERAERARKSESLRAQQASRPSAAALAQQRALQNQTLTLSGADPSQTAQVQQRDLAQVSEYLNGGGDIARVQAMYQQPAAPVDPRMQKVQANKIDNAVMAPHRAAAEGMAPDGGGHALYDYTGAKAESQRLQAALAAGPVDWNRAGSVRNAPGLVAVQGPQGPRYFAPDELTQLQAQDAAWGQLQSMLGNQPGAQTAPRPQQQPAQPQQPQPAPQQPPPASGGIAGEITDIIGGIVNGGGQQPQQPQAQTQPPVTQPQQTPGQQYTPPAYQPGFQPPPYVAAQIDPNLTVPQAQANAPIIDMDQFGVELQATLNKQQQDYAALMAMYGPQAQQAAGPPQANNDYLRNLLASLNGGN